MKYSFYFFQWWLTRSSKNVWKHLRNSFVVSAAKPQISLFLMSESLHSVSTVVSQLWLELLQLCQSWMCRVLSSMDSPGPHSSSQDMGVHLNFITPNFKYTDMKNYPPPESPFLISKYSIKIKQNKSLQWDLLMTIYTLDFSGQKM